MSKTAGRPKRTYEELAAAEKVQRNTASRLRIERDTLEAIFCYLVQLCEAKGNVNPTDIEKALRGEVAESREAELWEILWIARSRVTALRQAGEHHVQRRYVKPEGAARDGGAAATTEAEGSAL